MKTFEELINELDQSQKQMDNKEISNEEFMTRQMEASKLLLKHYNKKMTIPQRMGIKFIYQTSKSGLVITGKLKKKKN